MNIQIKEFSGPLDVLLQLIRREEMDIFDIDIHKITIQYLSFIEQNSITDLDSAGDFIRMAALLIYIKSKSLFATEDPDESEIENESDLKSALSQSLLKMQVVQSLCSQLKKQYSLLGRDVWSAGIIEPEKECSAFPLEPLPDRIKQEPILKLLRAHFRVLQKDSSVSSSRYALLLKSSPLPFLSDFIQTIKQSLTVGAKLKMSSLTYSDASKKKANNKLSQTLMTFLALLELSRLGVVSLAQDKDFADLDVFVKRQVSDKDFHSIQEF